VSHRSAHDSNLAGVRALAAIPADAVGRYHRVGSGASPNCRSGSLLGTSALREPAQASQGTDER